MGTEYLLLFLSRSRVSLHNPRCGLAPWLSLTKAFSESNNVQGPRLRIKRTWRICSRSGELSIAWVQINLLEAEKPCGVSSQLSEPKPQAGVWTKLRVAKPSQTRQAMKASTAADLRMHRIGTKLKGHCFMSLLGTVIKRALIWQHSTLRFTPSSGADRLNLSLGFTSV